MSLCVPRITTAGLAVRTIPVDLTMRENEEKVGDQDRDKDAAHRLILVVLLRVRSREIEALSSSTGTSHP